MIVTDASVILELLLQTRIAPTLERRLFGERETLHAPALLDVEVAQVLQRYARNNAVAGVHGRAALRLLARFPITRYSHEPLLGRIWSLRENLTAYDAAYVALAEGLGAPLLTRDAAFAAVKGHHAAVELI